ncbi:MAG TPA: hypothetical protein ENF83_00855 [Candidatus Korarchaeota archaeon]|nr:hypothetical protein [Candidatus Korarchaeota archaeon]
MSHDTSSDPRIVVAEVAAAGLAKHLPQLPRQHQRELQPVVGPLRQHVATLRYSFLPPRQAAEQGLLDPIESAGASLLRNWGELSRLQKPSERMAASWVRFAGVTLAGLRRRLLEGEPRFAHSIEAAWGSVAHVEPIAERLWRLKIDAGRLGKFTVVTNLPGVSSGDVRAFAVLPPRRIGGEISQGMLIEAEGEGEPGAPALPVGRSEGEVEAALREAARELGVRV